MDEYDHKKKDLIELLGNIDVIHKLIEVIFDYYPTHEKIKEITKKRFW